MVKDKVIEIFCKAKNIYSGGGVKETGRTERNIYFDVDDFDSEKTHQVTFDKTRKGWVIICDCDCTSRSLAANNKEFSPHFCSHILCSIFYTYHKTLANRDVHKVFKKKQERVI
jgi:hypothetical protein